MILKDYIAHLQTLPQDLPVLMFNGNERTWDVFHLPNVQRVLRDLEHEDVEYLWRDEDQDKGELVIVL